MAQQIKAFVFEPNSLSLSPRVHMVEGENQVLQVSSDLTHTCLGTSVHK